MGKWISVVAGLLFVLGLQACSDTAIVDVNQPVPHRNWSYIKKITVPVTITDAGKRYNIYMNLRHTADYKYSNLFVLIRQRNPDGKLDTVRKEFQLAYPDGEWLGSGSGNLYSYQLPVKTGYKFPEKGKYIFELEQNMRDNPLKEISDVGLRVEPVE
ncbi:gliding motility lipoprotein GldH (plasmid) [Pedobacter sp. BS3]|uniref:gliding motility lipoprotein GldH n=1 Tax=Pedobacter sp. BS3 TaxID=2567937 RepID=UPI0011EE3863|nr:gliding motility lipoprotein GldH [Pedobacter sp. BS3]TZF86233.1 gliding motility lipoprotein GldH [Pedobacter sp. BS3]